MESKVGSSYTNAYRELLEIFPDLNLGIESKTFHYSDINKIARKVFIKVNDDKTVSIEKASYKESDFVPPKQERLVARILRGEQEETPQEATPEVPKIKNDEDFFDLGVGLPKKILGLTARLIARILRGEQEERPQEATPGVLKIKNDEDFFDLGVGLPKKILGLTAGYFEETADVVVSLIKTNTELPAYLQNIDRLDLSNPSLNLDIVTFEEIIKRCADLKSLKLPENANDKWLYILAKKLPELTSLNLNYCENISDIGSLAALRSLTHLDLTWCQDIKDISSLTTLTHLNLSYCENISDIGSLADLKALTHLNLSGCINISDIRSLANLKALTHLNLSGCENINLKYFPALRSLTDLDLSGCKNSRDISLAALTSLARLNLADCANISDISSLADLRSLTHLDLSGCIRINDISILSALTSLTSLNLSGCEYLNLMTLPALRSLTDLDLSGCIRIDDISSLVALTSLARLNLSGCGNISDISSLAFLTSLTYLNLSDCENISNISSIAALIALTYLNLADCANISDISSLAALTSLTSLNLDACENISDISSLAFLTSLTYLSLAYCKNISDISPLSNLPALTSLDLRGRDIQEIDLKSIDPTEHFTRYVKFIGLDAINKAIGFINPNYPVYSVGSGTGALEEYIVRQTGIKVTCIDPDPSGYLDGGLVIRKPEYKYLKDVPEIPENATLLLVAPTPNDSTYDMEAINAHKWKQIIIIGDQSGGAVGYEAREWLDKVCSDNDADKEQDLGYSLKYQSTREVVEITHSSNPNIHPHIMTYEIVVLEKDFKGEAVINEQEKIVDRPELITELYNLPYSEFQKRYG